MVISKIAFEFPIRDGFINHAKGTQGGLDGAKNRNFLKNSGGELRELPPCCDIILQPGETVVSYCSGGGGYGPPYERPLEKVKHDLEEGWITKQRASDVYGIVFDDLGKIDETRTPERRKALAKTRVEDSEDLPAPADGK
jgi:N-methylhydantoinase B